MQKSYPLAARLGAVVLGFESIVAFLGGLVVFGLQATGPFEPWWGIVGGSVVGVLMIIAAGLCRYTVGIKMGWVLQFIMLAGAILNLAFVFVFLVFGGMWAYAMITSARFARQGARQADNTESD